jgi:hypothetical protein
LPGILTGFAITRLAPMQRSAVPIASHVAGEDICRYTN